MYRVWKKEGLNLRLPPQRKKIRREYQELLAPDGVNEGWAMDFVSDWVVCPEKQSVRVINIMGLLLLTHGRADWEAYR